MFRVFIFRGSAIKRRRYWSDGTILTAQWPSNFGIPAPVEEQKGTRHYRLAEYAIRLHCGSVCPLTFPRQPGLRISAGVIVLIVFPVIVAVLVVLFVVSIDVQPLSPSLSLVSFLPVRRQGYRGPVIVTSFEANFGQGGV